MGSSSVPGLATSLPAATSRSVTPVEVLGLATRIFMTGTLLETAGARSCRQDSPFSRATSSSSSLIRWASRSTAGAISASL